jgi:hypothetical protein
VSRTVLGGALGETPEVYSLHDREIRVGEAGIFESSCPTIDRLKT